MQQSVRCVSGAGSSYKQLHTRNTFCDVSVCQTQGGYVCTVHGYGAPCSWAHPTHVVHWHAPQAGYAHAHGYGRHLHAKCKYPPLPPLSDTTPSIFHFNGGEMHSKPRRASFSMCPQDLKISQISISRSEDITNLITLGPCGVVYHLVGCFDINSWGVRGGGRNWDGQNWRTQSLHFSSYFFLYIFCLFIWPQIITYDIPHDI